VVDHPNVLRCGLLQEGGGGRRSCVERLDPQREVGSRAIVAAQLG
jgi:hypothetical protein